MTIAIKLENVVKSYRTGGDSRIILDKVNLEIPRGEFVAVTGPSGSGKSTLLNIIGAIDSIDSGRVSVCSTVVSELTEHQRTLFRRQTSGFVFQFFNLIPTLTVFENLELPLLLKGTSEGSAVVNTWLHRFGLEQQAAAYPDRLSGGEQQRVSVIRAAIHEPDVILADEPTGNLDRKNGDAVLDLLSQVAEAGVSIVMVTHSDRDASIAHRQLLLQGGDLH